jgi:hypothetical protein
MKLVIPSQKYKSLLLLVKTGIEIENPKCALLVSVLAVPPSVKNISELF